MKSLISLPASYFPQYDELHVISDLHLGGIQGFQIFDSGHPLAKLIEHLQALPSEIKLALLVNRDLVDFLAEELALTFDPENALPKLNRILTDPAFAMVWQAFQKFVSTANRFLIINLGNHDLELALPWVREHLLKILSNGNEAARGRITLAFDGMGYSCRVGPAQILCVHGNEVDEWNIADFETIRRLGRDILQGQPVEPWTPNAGTQLVIQIMNGLKKQYPSIDLLKSEAQAVLPTLVALAPEHQNKLNEMAAVARRYFWDKIKIAAGFLGTEEVATNKPDLLDKDHLAPDFPIKNDISTYNQQYATALLEQTEKRLVAGVSPASLITIGWQGNNLSFSSAFIQLIQGEERSEVLREALERLQEDRSFNLQHADETFKRLDEKIGNNYDFIIAGHTHLDRSLPRQRKKGWYFNSGTWVK